MRLSTILEARAALDAKGEIVLYDSSPPCPASRTALKVLQAHGSERVRRYDGGLHEWASAGYPLEVESARFEQRPIYTSSTPTHANSGERTRMLPEENTRFCRHS